MTSKGEDDSMSHVRIGFAALPRRGFSLALFSAFLAFALFQQPGVASAQPVKQIKLTDKQVQGLIAAYKDMGALVAKIPQDSDKIDPKLQAQFEATAKKYGFASYAEYDDVFNNVSLVMSGIDPATKAFTEPPEALKRQIAEVQADKKMSKEEKKQALEDMNEALKDAKPVEFKENVALVTKYLDKLGAIMQQQP
jgi:hypothetical protein